MNEIMKIFVGVGFLAEKIMLSLSEKYGEIFKGGVFLFAASLAGLTQTLPVLLDHEYQARELEFKVEAEANKELIDLDCDRLGSLRVNCHLAKYKSDVVSSTVDFLNEMAKLFFIIGMIMMALSFWGYVGSLMKPIVHNKDKQFGAKPSRPRGARRCFHRYE